MKVKASGNKVLFVCNSCGAEQLRWSGKCPSCSEWNSLVEFKTSTKSQSAKRKVQSGTGKTEIISLSSPDLQLSTYSLRLKTGYPEFDRTLGGGFVPGQVVLLAGDPGIGKSTLLLQIADAVCKEQNPKSQALNPKQTLNSNGRNSKRFGNSDLENSNLFSASSLEFRVLYVAGEESPSQIRQRAERLGISGEGIEVVSTTDVEEIIQLVEGGLGQKLDDRHDFVQGDRSQNSAGSVRGRLAEARFSLVIIDSIQTLSLADVASSAGSVAQVKECAKKLTGLAKEKGIPLIMIGHVNKEGDIAGPKVLEHVVDTVLYLEGERTLPFRLLRAVKNRFGDPSEVGVWQMEDKGFKEVVSPGAAFIKERGEGAGTVLTVVLEGNRPILLEIQALTAKTAFGYPRRSITGYDLSRLLFIVAVLQKHLKLPLQEVDIYVNVTGGIKISEPAADLAVALAVVSSYKNNPAKEHTVVFGEMGLTGEIRTVSLIERRKKEAEKLGFSRIIAPGTVGTIKEAVVKALA